MLIRQICEEYDIEPRNTDWNQYRDTAPMEMLLAASTELYRFSGEDIVIVGGHAVSPELLGYRKMRKRSGDIDSVASERGVRELLSSNGPWDPIHYGVAEDELFLGRESIPLGVSLDKIHDWEVTSDFKSTSLVFEVPEIGSLRVASPEYQIMLKLRRGKYCMDYQRPFYGKDRIDISNILLASLYQGRNKAVDLRRLKELILEHISTNPESLAELWSNANLYSVDSLRRQERFDLEPLLKKLEGSLLL